MLSEMSQMEMGSNEQYCASTTTTSSSLHIMMFPFLAFGHISPFLQLARKISAVDSSVHFTILSAPANVSRINSLLSDYSYSSSSMITIHPLLLPRVPGLPEGAESTADLSPAETQLLKIAVDGTKPQLQSLLSQTKPDFVVFDFAQPWLPSIASPLGVSTLFFSVFAAIAFAYLVVPSRCPLPGGPTPTVDVLKTPPPGFPSTSSISTGVPTYQARDCSYLYTKFNDGPTDYDRAAHCLAGCTAIVFKTCTEMEGKYVEYVESEYGKPILLAGPVVPEPPNSGQELDPKWADWLGTFDEGSVVFCCFGSETLILDKEGVEELLLGLEMTGMPFLVVLNFPQGEGEMRRNLIPAGFEERVTGRGVVHCGWVQQQLILRHASVGCFLCHAGNSSFVEGVAAECKLVFLPQRGDHYLHSALFAGDLGVGVEVSRDENGGFRRDAVCESVKKAATDAEVREKHGKWRDFLMDKRMEERYMVEFVGTLKALLLLRDNEGTCV